MIMEEGELFSFSLKIGYGGQVYKEPGQISPHQRTTGERWIKMTVSV